VRVCYKNLSKEMAGFILTRWAKRQLELSGFYGTRSDNEEVPYEDKVLSTVRRYDFGKR
jgi:uncharacterized protein YutD